MSSTHPIIGLSRRPEGERACAWPGCDGTGEHRAPKSRERLRDYHWFCLEHVREYNKRWNYFEGMPDEEFDAMVRSTATWERPTWPLGKPATQSGDDGSDKPSPWVYWAAQDTMEDFRDAPDPGNQHVGQPGENARFARLGPEERHAFTVLGLEQTATLQDVKKRYKQLVKRYHPDANGSGNDPDSASKDAAAADRLRNIIQAYSHLVESGLLANPV